MTYYDKHTTNQILSLANTPASGYSRRNINAADIRNNGLEGILTARILDNPKGLMWDMQINYNHNRNKIIEIAPGVDAFQLGSGRANELFGVIVQAKVGDPIGTFYGRKFQRDPREIWCSLQPDYRSWKAPVLPWEIMHRTV